MRVCDRCKKGEVSTTIKIKSKSYDLCEQCLDRITVFLNSKSSNSTGGIGDMLKKWKEIE